MRNDFDFYYVIGNVLGTSQYKLHLIKITLTIAFIIGCLCPSFKWVDPF